MAGWCFKSVIMRWKTTMTDKIRVVRKKSAWRGV
jgi:hypothetical protein